jgi:hypothetical protein
VAYADGYLYAGCGNTLMVFDARSPWRVIFILLHLHSRLR